MKKSFLLIVFLIISSCASITDISTQLNTTVEFINSIPKKTEAIYVSKDCTNEQLYSEIEDLLIKRSHRIGSQNKEKFYINTDGKDVGFSTNQRMSITIFTENNLSVAKFTAEWMPGTEASIVAGGLSGIAFTPQWSKAYGGTDRPGIAFAEAAVIANSVSNGTIYYEKVKAINY